MVKVLFFGRIRETLGCASLELKAGDFGHDLEGLENRLVETRGEQWRKVFSEDNLIRAVNQEVVSGNVSVAEHDEVAFFPPVTGG